MNANRSLPTRRDFVKKSVAACSLTAAGAFHGREAAASPVRHPSDISVQRSNATLTEIASEPLTPYGSGDGVYLADFSRCEPKEAVSRDWQPNCWKLLDFTAEGVSGTLLSAGQNTAVPDVSLRVGRRGWCAVYFGLMSKYAESRLEVRLQKDDNFCLLTHHDMLGAGLERRDIELGGHLFSTRHFDELFWKYVEFDGNDEAIVLRQLKVQVVPGDPLVVGNRFMPCWLGYIKLVPLSDTEVRALAAERACRETRRLFAHNDSFGSPSWLRFSSSADIRREIEPFRDTDFSRMYWEAGMGDVTYYPSKVGRLFTLDWMRDHYRLRDRLVGETYAEFQAKGQDPFRLALDYCHDIGLEFHAAYRVAGFYFPAPEDEWNRNGLYHRHPEWRCVDREGQVVPRLSYAYPGVRRFVLDLLRELAAYPVDGVSLLYNRRMPLLEYEAPLVDTFRTAHGIDPRALSEDDPRWRAHCAAVLTDFMRDVRRLLDVEAQRQQRKKPIAITAVVLSSREEHQRYGLDLETWVSDGLVDTLIPYSSVPGLDSAEASWVDPRAADYFVQLTAGTRCRLALNLMPRQIAPEDYRRRAHALYELGVENLFFWDCYQRNNFDRSWSALRRLGHREELREWSGKGYPPFMTLRKKVTRLADWDLAYRTPG